MRIASVITGAFGVGLVCLSAACVQKVETVPIRGTGSSAVAPGLVLEQFLRAANAAAANDTSGIVMMGKLLGNRQGPVDNQWPRREVQQRMYLTASILKHDDYRILGEQIVPGRLNEARQINVEIVSGQRKVTVPFTMVLSRSDNWLVESIALEKVTTAGR